MIRTDKNGNSLGNAWMTTLVFVMPENSTFNVSLVCYKTEYITWRGDRGIVIKVYIMKKTVQGTILCIIRYGAGRWRYYPRVLYDFGNNIGYYPMYYKIWSGKMEVLSYGLI